MKKGISFFGVLNMNNKNNVNERGNGSTWSFVVWLILGGFFPIALIFLAAIVLTCSIVGVSMSTQAYKLANYYLYGAEVEVTPSYEADKIKNTIWIILVGWLLYIIHMFFAGLFYITYFGRNIGKFWYKTAKLSLMPFGIEIEVK